MLFLSSYQKSEQNSLRARAFAVSSR
ncbi:UNVERIFIED_CONTAM: hypothetical protein GTU68_040526 [Idotea baltica]|nr:hypothetical protein [Idotea baltica]